VQLSIFPKRAVHAKILRDTLRLVGDHFLQGDHAGIDSMQDFGRCERGARDGPDHGTCECCR
jgi:hypothetical protein